MLYDEVKQTIIDVFEEELLPYSDVFSNKENGYMNHIKKFMNIVGEIGYVFSDVYHAHGIGNNNEYTIYYITRDDDGFPLKREIIKFTYVLGVYGGVYVALKDVITDRVLCFCGKTY